MPEKNTKIKICGITCLEDALFAAEEGADFLGFIFHRPSSRYIEPQSAAEIIQGLQNQFSSDKPQTIGVFVNDDLEQITAIRDEVNLDGVQLHGEEPVELLDALDPIKFRSLTLENLNRLGSSEVDGWLCDTDDPKQRGGTGLSWDYDQLLPYVADYRIIIAGGLNPQTVGDVVSRLHPWAVDVSSGVECSPGEKDERKVRAFIHAVRLACSKT